MFYLDEVLPGDTFVLIETYWNVNDGSATRLDGYHVVLIETYWNVNT